MFIRHFVSVEILILNDITTCMITFLQWKNKFIVTFIYTILLKIKDCQGYNLLTFYTNIMY